MVLPGVIDTILSRRSVRTFTNGHVAKTHINTILDAGRWAPSGLNNQPWRYIVVQDRDTIEEIACCTRYSNVVQGARFLIAVFLDRDAVYNYVKDVQAVGASIQNMLLACCDLGLGAVWLGEILNRKEKVNQILNAPDAFELMAVLAIGNPADEERTSTRKAVREVAFNEKFGVNWVERDEELR
ncbi:MAG: nitroreductase family protein [Methanosarcinaceae archaeon]|nr:nitroreductase family protein [Methanosarcinaceae archaeon]